MIQVHSKIQPKMKAERRRKRIIRSRRRAQAKMAARTLLSVWRRSEGSGNVCLRLSTPHNPMTRLNHNRDRNPWERSSTPHGASDLIDIKKFNVTSPTTPSETSTNIPSDDDGQEFLNEWDEWSEHEVGRGPKAHWEDVHYDFNTGKVTTPAKAVPTAPTSKTPTASPRSTTS